MQLVFMCIHGVDRVILHYVIALFPILSSVVSHCLLGAQQGLIMSSHGMMLGLLIFLVSLVSNGHSIVWQSAWQITSLILGCCPLESNRGTLPIHLHQCSLYKMMTTVVAMAPSRFNVVCSNMALPKIL